MNDEDYIDDDEQTLDDDFDEDEDFDDEDSDIDEDSNLDEDSNMEEELEDSESEDEKSEEDESDTDAQNEKSQSNERDYDTEGYDRGFSYGQQRYNQSDIDRINNREKYSFGNQGVTDNAADNGSSPDSGNKSDLGDKNTGSDSDKKKDSSPGENAADKAKEGVADAAKDKAKEGAVDAAADKAKEAAMDKAKEEAANKAKEAVAEKAVEGASSSALVLKIKIIFWVVVVIFAILLIIGTASAIVFIILDEFGLTEYVFEGDEDGGDGGGGTTTLPEAYTNDNLYSPVGSTETTTSGDTILADDDPPKTSITKTYGVQSDGTMHYGVDYVTDNPPGVDNVIAVDDGTVVSVKCDCARESAQSIGFNNNEPTVQRVAGTSNVKCEAGYGNYVKISHSNGKYTLYAHLDEDSVTVSVGDTVKKGQVIGKIGNTGSIYTNLHFELFSDSYTRVDPTKYVDLKDPRPQSLANIKYVEGKDNKQTVCLSLLATGFSKNAVAGIMSNMESESGFRTNIPGDSGTSNGLCQWHNTRLTSLHNYCGDAYLSSLPCQLDFFLAELKTRSEYSYMIGNHTAYEMGHKFCYDFERPKAKETSCPGRGTKAQNKFLPYVENGCN